MLTMEGRHNKIGIPNSAEYARPRMAELLGLNPSSPDSWPLDLLDALARLEAREGRRALLMELDKLCIGPRR